MLSSMEKPNTGSTKPSGENSNYLRPSFLNHRGHNNSTTEETSLTFQNNSSCSLTNVDSGYSSLHNHSHFTPNNTPNVSSTSSSSLSSATVITTPQKSSSNQQNHHSNLITIPEIPDAVKLTPVTQNIRIFSNIHITTPKSGDFSNNAKDGVSTCITGGAGVKRSAISELKFDDYQSTPKKKRIDGDLESCPRNILSITTPLRGRKTSRSHRKLCRQKLRSAPDLDLNFFNDNAENIADDVVYGASQLTPIRSPFLLREQRTPLSSTSSNRIQASTPKTISKFDNGLPSSSSSVFDKPASVRKLLSFSDKEFEALLSSSSVPKEPSVTTESKASLENSVNTVDIYQEDSFREYKKNQPIISSYKSIIPPYVPETKAAKKSFKRTLKFAYKSSPSDESLSEIGVRALPSSLPQTSFSENSTEKKKVDETDTFHDDNLKDYKTFYPVIDNVIRDRRILKRQRSSTTARLVDIRRESHSITKLVRTGVGNKKFSSAETITQRQQQSKFEEKKESKEGEKGGFQKILGYVPSSCDLKISAREENKDDYHDNYESHVERKLSGGGSDMDISPNLLKFSVSPNAVITDGCESLREFNAKLLESIENGGCKLDSDLDISKQSSKGSSMSIDKTPEAQKNVEKVQESNIESNELLPLNQEPKLSPSNNIHIPDEFWLSNTDFETGILTPPRRRRSSTPSDCNVLQTNFCETEKFLPTTPKKMKLRSNHHTSVDYERSEILYPTIPRTPKKSSSQLKHKICATSSIPLKRKLSIVKDNEKRTKIFYDGFTHLNIIAKLESYDLVLDRIFNMLYSHDLMNLTLASKNLRNIVLSNQKAKQRISNYFIEYQKTKENDIEGDEYFTMTKKCPISKLSSTNSASSSFAARLSSVIQLKKQSSMPESNRMPFKSSNSIFDRRRSSVIIQRSPPVSPSKRKFHENQKVVKLLSCHEKLIKCPRCSRSSRIINTLSPALDSNGNHQSRDTTCFNSNLLQTYSKNQQAFHLSSRNTSTNFNNNNNNDEFVPLSNSQPSSSLNSFVPQSSSIRKTKPKFVKSMSADLALYLPTTPKKHQRSTDSNATVTRRTTTESNVFKQYGECTGILCKYRFCLDCLCEYHPDTLCKISSTVNNSPSKEDVQNGILEINSMYTTTTTATLATMAAAAASAIRTSPSSGSNVTAAVTTSSTSTGSRSLKYRRKSLKRLCF